MKQFSYFTFLLVTTLLLLGNGCKDPETPGDPNEEELITKVQLTFNDGTGAVKTAIYSDPDGDGGNAAVRFDSIRLDSGVLYQVGIALFDESDPSAIEDITAEVLEEAAEHLFCYTPNGANVAITLKDSDGTFPIGIQTEWQTGAASTGTVRIELRHQPDGQKDGTCIPGATDLQLDFVTIIQ